MTRGVCLTILWVALLCVAAGGWRIPGTGYAVKEGGRHLLQVGGGGGRGGGSVVDGRREEGREVGESKRGDSDGHEDVHQDTGEGKEDMNIAQDEPRHTEERMPQETNIGGLTMPGGLHRRGHWQEQFDESTYIFADHIVDVFGKSGVIIKPELGEIFEALRDGAKHDAHHKQGHTILQQDHETVITPEGIVEQYGENGALTEKGLIEACPMLLNCQLDSRCSLSSGLDEEEDDSAKSLLMLKIAAAGIFMVEAIVGGIVPVILGQFDKLNTVLSFMNCFSGGIFMGAGFIHMLPEILEAQHRVNGLEDFPLGGVLLAAGFMLIFFFEHVLCQPPKPAPQTPALTLTPSQNPIKAVNEMARETVRGPKKVTMSQVLGPIRGPVILLVAISVHSVFEALALGLQIDRDGTLLLLATIGSHKGVAAMALAARFVREGASRKQVVLFLGAFSFVAPVGVFSGVWVSRVPDLVLLILNGMAAGTVIYIGAYEVLSDEFGHNNVDKGKNLYLFQKFLAVVLGLVLMSILELIPHKH